MDADASFEGSTKLTSRFGYWPTFHDAEVLEIHLDRGRVDPEDSSYEFPVLTIRLHVFEMTNKVSSSGHFVLEKHTLTTLRFHDIEDCSLVGFNHQNAIFGLTVTDLEGSPDRAPRKLVSLEGTFGLDASFKCSKCEVVSAVPCDEKGRWLPNNSLERTREG